MTAYLTMRSKLSKKDTRLKLTAFSPLFCWSDGSILTVKDASMIIKDLALVCKLEGRFTNQSLRIGGATSLAQRGFSNIVIQKAGRWRSDAFKTYVRLDNNYFAQLPLKALLTPIVNGDVKFGYQM